MNYLSGYRMAFEFNGKLYFAGMGSPTATLIEVDPATNECTIAYHNINRTRGVANGVHGLLVYDGEILMCLATDNYDGNGTPGGIIVASSDPTAGLSSWRRIADQDDFDGLPAVMQTDGLNGGGVWDIIEYNGALYVTVVTDKAQMARSTSRASPCTAARRMPTAASTGRRSSVTTVRAATASVSASTTP